jgi:hypothetical protein
LAPINKKREIEREMDFKPFLYLCWCLITITTL